MIGVTTTVYHPGPGCPTDPNCTDDQQDNRCRHGWSRTVHGAFGVTPEEAEAMTIRPGKLVPLDDED